MAQSKQEEINKYITLYPRYKQLSQKIAIVIQEVLEIEGINFHAVTSRAKEIESFSKKIEKPKYNDPFNQITDLAGIRVISYVEDDVQVIGQIIERLFTVDTKNSLDKSHELGTDKVGYKSVHFICELPKSRTKLLEYSRFKGLKFEIQVRTILQHSWAEIEHDKNYKFSGELPDDIKRRFKLLAGTLEMADIEFNRLSKEIDDYSLKVREKTEKGELEIPINSTSLKQFLITRFKNEIDNNLLEPNFNGSDNELIVIKELNDFGLTSLSDLDKIIPSKLIEELNEIHENGTNFIGLIRNILLVSDYKKYFQKSYQNDWAHFSPISDFLFENYNLKLEDLESEMIKAQIRLTQIE